MAKDENDFATGAVNTGGKLSLAGGKFATAWLAPQILKKIWNDPNFIFRGLGEDDSRKKNLKQKIDTALLNVRNY
jgi:hypothetical protein